MESEVNVWPSECLSFQVTFLAHKKAIFCSLEIRSTTSRFAWITTTKEKTLLFYLYYFGLFGVCTSLTLLNYLVLSIFVPIDLKCNFIQMRLQHYFALFTSDRSDELDTLCIRFRNFEGFWRSSRKLNLSVMFNHNDGKL